MKGRKKKELKIICHRKPKVSDYTRPSIQWNSVRRKILTLGTLFNSV